MLNGYKIAYSISQGGAKSIIQVFHKTIRYHSRMPIIYKKDCIK